MGVDAEPHDVLPDGVLDAISLPAERAELAALPSGMHWDRILFCAKEATYKAWFPLTKRWLGFEDAHIIFTRRRLRLGRVVRIDDSDRRGNAVRPAVEHTGWTVVGGPRVGADGDHAMNAGLVVVDKPAGMTSHDVVGRCRRIFGTRRVGHAGTLDPMATGVLVIGIERATKILGLVTETSKSYAATVRLGQSTSTEDAEGELLQQVSAQNVTDEAIEAAVAALRGDIAQVPSAVSAIKVDGQRAYRLAREGRTVELAARPVRIDRFEVLAVRRHGELVDVDVEVDCSSGTYIRALARDIGAALEVGGHLTALRRTRVGRFGVDQARSLDDLAEQPGLSLTLDDACLLLFPHRQLTDDEADAVANGRALSPAASTASTPRTPPMAGSSDCCATTVPGRSRWSSSGRQPISAHPRAAVR